MGAIVYLLVLVFALLFWALHSPALDEWLFPPDMGPSTPCFVVGHSSL
jgi:hypothetical protein